MSLTTTDREKALAIAWSQRGVSESPPNSNIVKFSRWYGLTGPWCAMFVSWVFYTALGYSPFPATTKKGFAYCPAGVDWFKANGRWASKNVRPQRGWIVFFDFGKGRASHVAIVLDVLPDGRLHTIEGNTNGGGSRDGGSVMEHYRSLNSVVGYGVMEFTAETPQPPAKPKWTMPKFPGRTLTRGMEGPDIAVLKVLLVDAGLGRFMSMRGNDVYKFGSGTGAAVKVLKQQRNALLKAAGKLTAENRWDENDESVGNKTWGFLGEVLDHKHNR